ncbi:MAG: tetratricopeptide repeat protein, partial [Caldilineaceae bacterium]|nr:tetratricopeptide repeat protein [Caldilineaceae bacterium]
TVADQWPTPAVFWYTIRPTFNDQLESLLFALGHFLHTHGASTLWHQLVADAGRIVDINIALGLALGDLRAGPHRPLLCFDDVDFLRPPHAEQPNPQHTRVLEFLDSLRGHAPVLLMGQRAFWESDAVYPVAEFTRAQLAAWLTSLAIPHHAADVDALHAHTGGNPRLAELCVVLYQAGASDSLAAVMAQLPQSHALLPIWHRLARRLSPRERQLVHALAVFRSPAPADAWEDADDDAVEDAAAGREAATASAQLVARRLVQQDERGGVTLLPSLREVIYADLPVEMQEELHQQAAQIRAARGEYTAAAYHLHRAGLDDAAVELWYPQRTQEINRGQGGAALTVFSQISQRRLAPRLRKQLLLIRAELHELTGAADQVIDDLAAETWAPDDLATPDAMLHLGDAQEARGQGDVAQDTYQAGLDAAAHLLRQSTQLHVQRSMTKLRRRDMAAAWREANLARYHAETMLGVVNDQRGDYDEAAAHYAAALAIATAIDHQAGVAQMHHYLLILATRRQDMAGVLRHGDAAIEFYERVGDRVNRECVRSNLASAYIQVGRFDDAIEPAAAALRFFEAVENPFRVAQNASNLAEAHAELGNLDAAATYAELVLQQEEPHSHPYALFTLGKVHGLRGQWTTAQQYYDQSRRIAEMNDDTYLLAYAWRALGEVHQALDDAPAAHSSLAHALQLFQRLDMDEEIRRTQALLESVTSG